MAVIDVKEDGSKQEGPVATAEGQSARRGFTVLLDGADSPALEGYIARTATGVPRVYESYHVSLPFLRCIEVAPRRVGLSHLFEVDCSYETGPKSEDPLNEPISEDWNWGEYVIERELEYDFTGRPITNTAGTPFEGLTEPVAFPMLALTRPESYFHGLKTMRYKGSVNAYAFRGAPGRTCWMANIVPNRIVESARTYWMVRYEIVWNPLERPPGETQIGAAAGAYLGWQRRLLNHGLSRLVFAKSEKYPAGRWERQVFKEGEGDTNKPITEPVSLTANGQDRLDEDVLPIWLYYQTKPVRDWRALHLE